MKDLLAKLILLGAETVCGDMYLKRVKVGYFREGVFIPTADAQRMIDELDVVEKPSVEAEVPPGDPAPKPAQRKAKAEKTKAALDENSQAPAPDVELPNDPTLDLDKLLGSE